MNLRAIHRLFKYEFWCTRSTGNIKMKILAKIECVCGCFLDALVSRTSRNAEQVNLGSLARQKNRDRIVMSRIGIQDHIHFFFHDFHYEKPPSLLQDEGP